MPLVWHIANLSSIAFAIEIRARHCAVNGRRRRTVLVWTLEEWLYRCLHSSAVHVLSPRPRRRRDLRKRNGCQNFIRCITFVIVFRLILTTLCRERTENDNSRPTAHCIVIQLHWREIDQTVQSAVSGRRNRRNRQSIHLSRTQRLRLLDCPD